MQTTRLLRVLLAAGTLASGAAFAGTADVKFIAPDRFTDLATTRSQERQSMDALSAHLQRLAAALPADQVLHVDVLDVDLAGHVHRGRRGDVRVDNGRADGPMIHLRWSLESRGQTVRSGDEHLTDLDYTHGQPASWRATGPFYYEKRMLSSWFTRTFGERHAAR